MCSSVDLLRKYILLRKM